MIKSYEYCRLGDGRTVTAYEIFNSSGESAVILDYGGTVAKLNVLDRNGNVSDVVLGADPGQDVSRAEYEGTLMGRCGNRIANAEFEIDGRKYRLTPTEGPNHLHGAAGNWAKQIFEAVPGENSVTLKLRDDGRDGWECEADAEVTYSFDDRHALTIAYEVKALGNTVISPTNHSYFNLDIPNSVLNTEMRIFTDTYAPKSELHMPDGRMKSVKGTPLDFTVLRSFAENLSGSAADFFPPYQDSFDDFYVIPGEGFRQVAEARCHESGRVMKVFSDAQGLILYTPVVKGEVTNKGGRHYSGHAAFCLETQYVPNAVNCPEYRSPVVRGGETMSSKTVYLFGLE